MKLLFDQNISFRVVNQLRAVLSESVGVGEVGLLNADDFQIWEYARQHGFSVVTFDRDIPDIGAVRGFPPKIIWLRTGNLTNRAIVALFNERMGEFAEFVANGRKGCLQVFLAQNPENENPEV